MQLLWFSFPWVCCVVIKWIFLCSFHILFCCLFGGSRCITVWNRLKILNAERPSWYLWTDIFFSHHQVSSLFQMQQVKWCFCCVRLAMPVHWVSHFKLWLLSLAVFVTRLWSDCIEVHLISGFQFTGHLIFPPRPMRSMQGTEHGNRSILKRIILYMNFSQNLQYRDVKIIWIKFGWIFEWLLVIMDPGSCFTNILRALQNNLTNIYNARNRIYGENFKLRLCTCVQSMTLGTHTKLQLEILTRSMISAIYNFQRIFWRARKTLVKHSPDTNVQIFF